MALCQSCRRVCRGGLCPTCALTLRRASPKLLPGGVPLHAAFEHSGAARVLVHHLKYRGMTGYADLVAEVLHERLGPDPLVPVPRVLSRSVRYGVDGALVLAQRISRRTGAPVLRLLAAPLHSPQRAGGKHDRTVPRYRVRGGTSRRVILVDDVVTTGATLRAAIASLGAPLVTAAASANLVPEMSSLLASAGERRFPWPQSS